MYFFKKLPSLFFWGVRVKEINQSRAEILVKFGWRTQNPFKSIYFSTLAGTAELSTGLLAFLAIEKANVSMLVVGMQARFMKKAKGEVVFICEQGDDIFNTVNKAIETGEGQEILVTSKGYNEDGDIVAEFDILWSFKKRGL
jgi:hypothetical protein